MRDAAEVPERLYTPEDLLKLTDGPRYELLDGRLVEKNHMGAKANRMATVLIRLLDTHADAHGLGLVFSEGTGYQIFGERRNRVRIPDGSFIGRGRLPDDDPPDGHVRLVPDWMLEVVSPNDLAEEIDGKVAEYLAVGVRLLWVLYPSTRCVYVFRRDGSLSRLTEADELTGEDVLPGFVCRVAVLFQKREAQPGSPQ